MILVPVLGFFFVKFSVPTNWRKIIRLPTPDETGSKVPIPDEGFLEAGSVTPCHAALLPGTDKVVTVTTSVRDDRSTLSHHPKKIIITLIAIIFIQLLALVFLIYDKTILSEKMIQDNSSAHQCDQNFDSLTSTVNKYEKNQERTRFHFMPKVGHRHVERSC